jgi:hypothetical protein
MSEYPEHDKLHAIKDESQAIGEFLDWVRQEYGANLIIPDDTNDMNGDNWHFISLTTEQLLAAFFDINLDAIEEEKRTILDAQVRLNARNDLINLKEELAGG